MFKYKEYKKPHVLKGVQYLFKFENNAGASVIQFPGSYGYEKGLWEIATIYWYEEDRYTAPYEVTGWLNVEEVNKILDKLKKEDR